MTRQALLPLALLGLLLGTVSCNDTKDTADVEGDTDTDTDTDTDADGDGDADADGVSPYLEAADAYCYYHKTGDTYYQWEVNCQADDPQGADTLAAIDTELSHVTVLTSAGGEVAQYALVCEDDGDCFGSFKEADDGVACKNATTYTLRFQVADEDGNTSAPLEIQGRQQ